MFTHLYVHRSNLKFPSINDRISALLFSAMSSSIDYQTSISITRDYLHLPFLITTLFRAIYKISIICSLLWTHLVKKINFRSFEPKYILRAIHVFKVYSSEKLNAYFGGCDENNMQVDLGCTWKYSYLQIISFFSNYHLIKIVLIDDSQ